jgi:hypothetical protein
VPPNARHLDVFSFSQENTIFGFEFGVGKTVARARWGGSWLVTTAALVGTDEICGVCSGDLVDQHDAVLCAPDAAQNSSAGAAPIITSAANLDSWLTSTSVHGKQRRDSCAVVLLVTHPRHPHSQTHGDKHQNESSALILACSS